MEYTPWLAFLVVVFFALPFLSIYGTVHALSFIEPAIPVFGIVADGAQIVSESVTVDIDNFEPNSLNSYANVESVYTITKQQGSQARLSIPYFGKITDAVNIAVSVNGEPTLGEIRYGDSYFLTNKTPDPNDILSDVILPDLSGVPDGTLYKFTPTENTLTVDMRFDGADSLIYDSTRSLSSSLGQGYFNLKLNNAVPGQTYNFFVVNGDFSEPPESNAEYSKQPFSCKAYIDGFFR